MKFNRVSKGAWIELVLLFTVVFMLGYAIMGLTGCEYEPPQEPTPVLVVDRHGNPYNAVVNDMYVRVYSHAEGWSQWELITEEMGATLPEDQVLVLQFKHNGMVSSLAGFSWPELETCFIMPEHVEGNSTWRLTYSGGPQEPWPAGGRVEFRYHETHVTQSPAQTLYFMAELWDEGSGSYVDQSPWFAIRWTNVDPGVEFHEEELEELR